jgi:hypothetical protein
MIKEDDELLRKEAQKIECLQKHLEEEERKYDEIAAKMTDELQNEASIYEEEQKLEELRKDKERNLNSAHHHYHH